MKRFPNPDAIPASRIGCLLVFVLFAASILGAHASSADSVPVLTHDPFRERPVPAAPAGPSGRREDRRSFTPILHSTIVGSQRSLANFGGKMLKIGEEAHGYQLIDVKPFAATFMKDGERIELEVSQGEGARR